MATTTASGITATIPDLTDNADIQTAFINYHASVADDISGKANTATPTFTGNIVATGTVSANSGTYATSTVTLIGQANAAIASGRYNANATGGTFNGNALDTSATRIFVSKATPTANITTGDIWISWT
jgi:hypothetical protein